MKAKENREELILLSNNLKDLVDNGVYENMNKALISYYKQTYNLTSLKGFEQWNSEGFIIKKGSKGYKIWGKPRNFTDKQTDKDKTEEQTDKNEPYFYPIAYLFSEKQVVKSKKDGEGGEQEEQPKTKSDYFRDMPKASDDAPF